MPLVGFDGHAFKPAGFTDDVGIYYIVPRIATWLELDLERSVDVFLGSMVLLSLVACMGGMFLLYRRWSVRFVVFLMLAGVSMVALNVGDVYLVNSSVVIAMVPWCVYLHRRESLSAWHLLAGLPAGILIGTANFLRSHSGTAVLVFLLALVLSRPRADRTKNALLAAVVLLGILLSSMPFRIAVRERDRFLERNAPGYGTVVARHPFWHSIYIGFGYLSNEYGIRFDDAVAARKVREISPKAAYVSAEYERILRGETFHLALRHPLFVLRTIFAKAGPLPVLPDLREPWIFLSKTLSPRSGGGNILLRVARVQRPSRDSRHPTAWLPPRIHRVLGSLRNQWDRADCGGGYRQSALSVRRG